VYYVEFFRKKPGVSWDDFRDVVGGAYKRWVELHPEDAPVVAMGRTWRLGPPEASYIIVWKIPDLAKLDDWTRARREHAESDAAVMHGTLSVADMDAGVYDDIGLEML
jgi:hypothetical protein